MHEPCLRGEPDKETKPIADLFARKVIDDSMMKAIKRKYIEEVSVVDSFFGGILEWLKNT